MNKQILFLVAFIILLSNSFVVDIQPAQKKAQSQTVNLDSIRSVMKGLYSKQKNNKGVNNDFLNSTNQNCKPCDINFLVLLENKRQVSKKDIENLFCINPESCNNNVEFMQFYNEVVIKTFNKFPKQFSNVYWETADKEIRTKTGKMAKRVWSELKNPVYENIKPDSTLLSNYMTRIQ